MSSLWGEGNRFAKTARRSVNCFNFIPDRFSRRLRSRWQKRMIRCFGVSTVFPRVPPTYGGSRLLVCVMLSIGVAGFFLTYGHLAHRRTPSLSYELDTSTIVPQSLWVMSEYENFDEPPLPDMRSPAVKFAGADVLQAQDAFVPRAAQPRKPQIKTIVEPKKEQRRRSVKQQKAKPTRVARLSEGRAVYSHR